MSAEGGCLCGAVRYRVDGAIRDVVWCHCRDCLRAHGGPAPYSAARRADLTVTGELAWYTPPSSAAGGRRGFCPRCGSSILWDAPGDERVAVAAGSVDDWAALQSAARIYTAHMAPWETGGHVPRAAGSGGGLPDVPWREIPPRDAP